jgi:hypothetical protein
MPRDLGSTAADGAPTSPDGRFAPTPGIDLEGGPAPLRSGPDTDGSGLGDGDRGLLGPALAAILGSSLRAPDAGSGSDSAPVGLVIGRCAGIDASGDPLVDYPGNPSGRLLVARSLVPCGEGDVGREAALLFEGGDPCRPILMGLLRSPAEARPASPEDAPSPTLAGVEVDGDRLVLSADREIVLRCGEASITLTRAGKILIRGKYLLSRSDGVNRIKGGSVQIN